MTTSVEDVVAAARAAAAAFANADQDHVDDVVAAVGWQCYQPDHAQELAALTVAETMMGSAEDLFQLYRRRVLGALHDLHGVRTVGVVRQLPDQGLAVLAKPLGVIAIATPATAPCSGIACNVVQMLKTRNAIVVSPNPRAQTTADRTVELIRAGLRAAGAPSDLVQCLTPSTHERCEELMRQADFVVAAGGSGTVRRAYTSGTPAISAGVGNPTVIVDESADLEAAARMIVLGASFNHGTSCSSESNVLVHQSISDRFLALVRRSGGHICDSEQITRLCEVLWPPGRGLDREMTGRSAATLAGRAGFNLGPEAKALVVVADSLCLDDPVFGEKLAPVFTVSTYTKFDDAVDRVRHLALIAGRGHSCAIHTADRERPLQLAAQVEFVRVLVNQSTAVGNSGDFDNGLAFTSTITSGSWGGCSLSENVTWSHFLNYTWVSSPIAGATVRELELFGRHWDAGAITPMPGAEERLASAPGSPPPPSSVA